MSGEVKAMKAVSNKAALTKVVKLLIQKGIDVRFRGVQPYVASVGNRATMLVLPEIDDNSPPELMEAIHGFLDHEVGHILFTPFARAARLSGSDIRMKSLVNIIEDIRLEKLLPRDLPGTRENLERMYEAAIPTMFDPAVRNAVSTGDKSQALLGVLVVAMRALAGQRKFEEYMDQNNLWPHFAPILKKMPKLSRELREMEEFSDVERIAKELLDAFGPPPEEKDDKDEDDGDDKGEAGDSASKKGGGKGKGSGKGQSSDSEDDDDEGSCAGDEDSDEPGDGKSSRGKGDKGDDDADAEDGDGEGGDDDDGDNSSKGRGKSSDEDDDDEGDDDTKNGKSSEGGKNNRSITDALKLLEPAQRRALFLYKKREMSVSEISSEMSRSEGEVRDLLRNARRRLNDLMNGDK